MSLPISQRKIMRSRLRNGSIGIQHNVVIVDDAAIRVGGRRVFEISNYVVVNIEEYIHVADSVIVVVRYYTEHVDRRT